MGKFERLFWVAVLMSLGSSTPLVGQTNAINQRAESLIKARKKPAGLATARVVERVLNEQEPSLACLAVGIMTESDRSTADYVQVLMAAAKRPDCFYQIATQVVLANQGVASAEMILQGSRKKEHTLLAANLLAIHSQLDMMTAAGKPKGKKGGKNRKSGPAASVAELIKQLLGSKDRAVLELALLSAAHLGINVDEEVASLEIRRSPAAEAARLLYLAGRGQPLDNAQIEGVAAGRFKSDKRFQEVSPALSTYAPTSHPLCYLAQALAAAGDTSHMKHLHAGLEHPDIRVQSDCAKAIETLGQPASLGPLQQALPGSAWPARIRIYSALGAIPDPSSVPVLLDQLGRETGRFRLDCVYALSSIIGEDKYTDLAGWRQAWQELESTFEVNRGRTSTFRKENRVVDMYVRSLGAFYQHGIYSDRLVYVVDTSASMKGEKIKDLESNLAESAASLKDPARFSILTFGGAIQMISDRLQVAAAGDAISDLLYGLKLSYATRTHDAIQMATLYGEVDTIYFLSDGAPVSGALGKWHTIIPAYRYFHRYRPIALFTVPFKAGEKNARMMKLFAEENYGQSGGTEDAE